MRRGDLILWMLVYPWSTVFVGLAFGLASYLATMPRKTEAGRGELTIEAWRLLAIASAVPAFFLGAELVLWWRDLDFRAPLAFTGLIWASGLWLLFLAPIPLAASWVWGRPLRGRPVWLSGVILASGMVLILLGPRWNAQAWGETVDLAASEPAALERLVQLKSHRYVSRAQATQALDALLPSAEDILGLVKAHEDHFDAELRRYATGRLVSALEPGDASPAFARESVPAIWRLGAGGPFGAMDLRQDAETTLRAYALTRPALRPEALRYVPGEAEAGGTAGGLDFQRVGLEGLRQAPESMLPTLVEALQPLVEGQALEPSLIDALAEALDAPAPVDASVLAILLENGSQAALRPVLPRFLNADGQRGDFEGPVWAVLRSQCMARTTGLSALREDSDPRVAAGAEEVYRYVRQYCGKRWRQG
jgi:hypothetical protein